MESDRLALPPDRRTRWSARRSRTRLDHLRGAATSAARDIGGVAMAKDMDTRLKMGPLKPQRETIKSRNPLLKNNGINTSALSSMLQKYDAALTRYKTLDADWWKLDKALPPMLAAQKGPGHQDRRPGRSAQEAHGQGPGDHRPGF